MSSQEPQAASAVPQDTRPPRERRGRMRHSLSVPATVRLRGPSIVSSPTQILDLSEEGIGVQTSAALQPDRTLALDLELDSQRRIRLIGQVAWSEPSGRAGVRFFSPDHAALQEIQEWLFLNAVASVTESARAADLIPQAKQFAAGVPKEELFLDEEQEEDGDRQPVLSPLERDTNAIVTRALALTGAKGAALALYEGGQLICRATCGTDTPALGSRISVDSGITGECVRFGRVMYCSDAASDGRVDREICADLGIRSLLALPLFAGNRVVGLLEVLSQRRAAFDPGDAKALDMLARPVIGMLFAEGPLMELSRRGLIGRRESTSLLRDRALWSDDLPGDDLRGEALRSEGSGVDLGFIERQRERLARDLPPKVPIRRRVLAGVALLCVLGVAVWLILTQSKTLASLGQGRAAASSQPRAPQLLPVSVAPSVTPADAASNAPSSLAGLQASAERGDALAQFALGAKYSKGEGFPQDQTEAARWFTLAAMKGYAPAQSILGACYWVGRGVPKDLKQAYFWSVLARQGNDEMSKDRADALATRLSQSELLEVRQLVLDWNRKHAPTTATVRPPR
jgi:putative methionine-R-sulfoxide reductase with GAF domain